MEMDNLKQIIEMLAKAEADRKAGQGKMAADRIAEEENMAADRKSD
jgi:hypothetical protein